jgi:23S rRNA pseudouridine1911/1915/1917 synthase
LRQDFTVLPNFFEERPDNESVFETAVDEASAGLRLDVFLAGAIEDASRSFLQRLIKAGAVTVNGEVGKRASRIMVEGDTLTVAIPPAPSSAVEAENIPLDILYEDADLLVVNKAAGLVVHPAPGNYTGTLVNAVLYHCPDFTRPGQDPTRPGIVHRLDRDTSGVMVIAKSPVAFLSLAKQAHDHAFERRYLALVRGTFKEEAGRIEAAVGRSLVDPKRMTITGIRGRKAVTHFTVKENLGLASLISLQLETGRTHQIRVHLRFAGHPVLGDPTYGVIDFTTWAVTDEVREILQSLKGQALHAEHLGFHHPVKDEMMRFTAPLPEDFQKAVDALREVVGVE